MKAKKPAKVKKKPIKKSNGEWVTREPIYHRSNPFKIEWLKFYNKAEGRDQIIFLYLDRRTGVPCKFRMLR